MNEYVKIASLKVAKPLYDLVQNEIAPGTPVKPSNFWRALGEIVLDLEPKNEALLAKRKELQLKIDDWHRQRKGQPIDMENYRTFLTAIGYLIPEGENFQIAVEKVDPEVSEIAGPQLVVPLDNARYALNATNARWGSLYDALYGTDAVPKEPGLEKALEYNPKRGDKCIRILLFFFRRSGSAYQRQSCRRYCIPTRQAGRDSNSFCNHEKQR